MTPPVGRRASSRIGRKLPQYARVFGAPRNLLPLRRSHDLHEWHGEGRVGDRSRKMLKGPAVESEKARGLGQRVEVGQGRAHARKTSSFQ